MKRYLSFIFLAALLVSSCAKDVVVEERPITPDFLKFTAAFEQDESRAYIEDGKFLRWTEGDQITLFVGNTLNRKYMFDGETGDNGGTFSIVENPFGTGYDLNCHYAVYPYNKDIKITEAGVITATIPTEQSYAENSFGLGANTMVAVTENVDDTFLKFRNVSGYLKLQLYGDNVTVKSITLSGNNEEKLAGKATITPAYGQEPTIVMADDATTSITLNCGDGVKIGTTEETSTAFWIVVPPTTFAEGFEITITDVNGDTFTKSTSKEIVVERNMIKPMSTFNVEIDRPYITFEADAEQTLTMSKAVETLEYSVNGNEWQELGTNTITFGENNGNLRLRGKSMIGTAIDKDNYSTIDFGDMFTSVACTGDIRTLIDYENYTTVDTSQARFCRLFSGCIPLTKAPDLPATNLADYCYYSMFNTCIYLTNAPELPAIYLSKSCYSNMFAYCESLIEAPSLPATSLAEDCYAFMFRNCINLKKIFDLPAITLAKGCYRSMFRSCRSLEIAPNLSATTLAESCCNGMFCYCTNLIKVPNLPAMILAPGCYAFMFSGCKNLATVPILPAITLANTCYYLMFSGCTNLINAPELPATKLEDLCYFKMFYGCTSLVNAPELPATQLVNSCYESMFEGCTNLNNITMLATDISASSCLNNWILDVSAEGIFTKKQSMDSLPSGASGVPIGWIVIDKD